MWLLFSSLQTITLSDTLPEITETLYPLMEGLHMLWLLSRFYCRGEQMVPLMERIAWVLCSQAKTHLQLRDIFK
jgi:dynein heavy chain